MMEFILKEEHIKLLNNVFIQWNNAEFGAPEIDPKRPYGNSGTQIFVDMMDILNIEKKYDMNDEIIITKDMYNYLYTLHKELETALQIILRLKSFRCGKYKKENEYSYSGWVLDKDQ